MPAISSTNSGSGLDVRNLVDQLVAAERDPIASRLDKKEIDVQQGLTAIGTYKGALIDFQSSLTPLRNADAFKAINATSSDEEKFTVSAEDNAVVGSYDIEISQLAQSQKLKSQSFDSEFDIIGSGTISFQFGEFNSDSNSFDVNSKIPTQYVDIDESNGSLRGIQQAINSANIGVRASMINDGNGYRLIISSEKTGTENSLRITVSDNDTNNEDASGLSQLTYNPVEVTDELGNVTSSSYMEQVAESRNALFSIDGISISSATNEVSNSIPGITLNLKKLTEDGFESFKVEKETAKIKQSIESFVGSYNELMSTVNLLTGVDQETGQAGPLAGDASIRGMTDQIRRRLSASFNGINENLTSLASIGIDSNLDGTLTLNDSKLNSALENHADEIAHLFAATVSTSDPKIRVTSKKVPETDGVFNISIDQTPTSGSLVGSFLPEFPLQILDVPEKMVLSIDNVVTGEIRIKPQIFSTGKALASELERLINNDENLKRNGSSVSVNYINNTISITSNNVGLSSSVAVTSISQTLSSLSGLFVSQGQAGKDLKGRINGYDLVGDGTKLKLEGVLRGVVLDVSGEETGERGDLTVTNGVASILDELSNSFLENDGLLDARIDGYNAKIKNIEKQRSDLVRKLEVSEQRYLKQFSNLDAMLGKMRSTSNFLAEKLSNLPGAAKK